MSRTYSKLTNKQQKYPKVHFKEYLYNTKVPRKFELKGISVEIEAALSEDIESMRKAFRHRVYRMRNRSA